MISREKGFEILKKYVSSKQLIKHSLAVEAAMRAYAKEFKEDVEYWGMIGLLHDIDFELYPQEHPLKAPDMLKEHGFDEKFIEIVLSHGSIVDLPRDSKIKKALHAVDEMASFIIAIALMRPNRFEGLKLKSVKKKMKDKAFAKAVDREELLKSAEDLEVEFSKHVDIVVKGLSEREEFLKTEGLSLLE